MIIGQIINIPDPICCMSAVICSVFWVIQKKIRLKQLFSTGKRSHYIEIFLKKFAQALTIELHNSFCAVPKAIDARSESRAILFEQGWKQRRSTAAVSDVGSKVICPNDKFLMGSATYLPFLPFHCDKLGIKVTRSGENLSEALFCNGESTNADLRAIDQSEDGKLNIHCIQSGLQERSSLRI